MAFFSNNSMKSEPGFVYVGKEPFHVLAVALIDALKYGARLDELSLKKILEGFASYYPKLMSPQAYLNSSEKMMRLILNNLRQSEIVDSMAYVLRQIAVDAIYAQPQVYQKSFEGLNADTPMDHMRHLTTVLPLNALNAAADVLGINLILLKLEHGHDVRALTINPKESDAVKMDLVLQVQGEHIFPKVRDKKEYAFVGHTPMRTVPLAIKTAETGTVANMLSEIDVHNKRIFVTYEQTRKTLLSMIFAGELSKKCLVDFYVDLLPAKNELYTEQFFSQLGHLDKMPAAALSLGKTEQQPIDLLVNGLARWISTDQISEDQLFNRIDLAIKKTEPHRALL